MATAQELACLDEIAAGEDAGILQQDYRPRLLYFARMMGVPPQDCADVVQEVLLIAIRDIRCGRFRRDSSLITWLDGILKHKIGDLWRAQTRQRSLFVSVESESSDEEVAEETGNRPNRGWDEDIDVRRVLDRMPAELRMILLLNEAEGLTLDEISRRLHRPQGTLGRKLAEAKKVFRRQLA